MSANENHPIEKELQREAARRRAELAGREFELSAGARNTLQTEVDKTYHRPEPLPEGRWSWLGSMWTKLAVAGVGVVALVLGLQLAERATPTSTPGPGDLARLEDDVATREAVESRDQMRRLRSEADEPAESLLNKTENLGRDIADIPAPAADSAELGAAFEELRTTRGFANSFSSEAAPPARLPEPAADAPRRLAMESSGLEFRQPTPQAAPPSTSRPITSTASPAQAAGPSSPSQVMQRFQLQVAGDQILFIDEDGSRYAGSLQQQVAEPLDQVASTTSAPSAAGARYGSSAAVSSRYGRAAEVATQALVQQGLFTAEGTNLTVGQNVQVSGRFYVQGADTNRLSDDYLARYGDLFKSVGNVLVLTGKAVVGETNEVPIHAEAPAGN